MARQQQIEKRLDWDAATEWGDKPWGIKKVSHRDKKQKQHRRERRRAKIEPDCFPEYNKYDGFDW